MCNHSYGEQKIFLLAMCEIAHGILCLLEVPSDLHLVLSVSLHIVQ